MSSDGSTCAYRYSTEGHNGYLDTYGFSIPAGATIDRNQVEYMCSWDEDPPGANSPGINIGKNEATLATEKIDGSIPIRSGGTCTVSFTGGNTNDAGNHNQANAQLDIAANRV